MRTAAAMGAALQQAFMTREEYQEVREEDRAWRHLRRPLALSAAFLLFLVILAASSVSLSIVFPGKAQPFCSKHPIPPSGILDDSMHSYYFTEYEATQYFWLVVFLPTAVLFLASAAYLFAGMAVAYAAPDRHCCVQVVENNCCASKKGGVGCLATLNVSFAVVFGLFALFLGSSILTLQTDCSVMLFWCYEMISWSFVLLYGSTFLFLRRKAAVILDDGEFYGARTVGMELLEGYVDPPSPGMERRVNVAFRAWMGSSILSDDDGDGDGDDDEHVRHGLGDVYHDLEDGRK